MATKTKFPTFSTPKGEAVYPWLTQPDTKYKDLGEYHCKIAFDADSAEWLAFKAKMEPIRDEAVAEMVKEKPARKRWAVAEIGLEEIDQDTGDPTGRVVLNTKKAAAFLKKETDEVVKLYPPDLFDAKGKQVKDVQVWSGSVVRIAGHVRPYAMESNKTLGLSFKLDAVQIIELSEGAPRDGATYGFGEEEGGFEADNAPTFPSDEEGEPTDDSFGEDGDF